MSREISDEILNAHIDNELGPSERAELVQLIAADPQLRSRACELWQVKQMLRGAYPLPRGGDSPQRTGATMWRWLQALAASLLLLCGAVSGWLFHEGYEDRMQLARQIEAIRAEGGRVVLHLFSDEPMRMQAALATAERLADVHDSSGRPFRIEFVANGPGLHLLRSGGSPYEARIAALQKEHDNIRLIACNRAIERLRERGVDVVLLPGVEEAPSAEGRLAQRLTQGWRYIQS